MASFMERKTRDNKIRYTAIVRIKGYPKQSATFSRKTDAKLWAQQIESSIRDGKYFSQAEAKKHTFADLAERYIKTVLENKSLRVQMEGCRSQYWTGNPARNQEQTDPKCPNPRLCSGADEAKEQGQADRYRPGLPKQCESPKTV